MATYRARELAKTWLAYTAGVPIAPQGASIQQGALITATDLNNGVLEIVGTPRRWTRKRWFDLVNSTPPPPPVADEYILHVKDGVTRKFVPE